MSDYKTSKEAFVSGMTGSSVGHINLVSLVSLSSIALHSAVITRLPPVKPHLQLIAELVLLVFPVLLSITLFARAPAWLCLILLIPIALLVLIPRRESGTPLPSMHTPSRPTSPVPFRNGDGNKPETREVQQPQPSSSSFSLAPVPALTTYRAHMLLLTFLCILAVDFPVFPRSLAKCETFGVSLMDLGVGSFVFSQGIVSAIPLIKNPEYLTKPLIPKVLNVVQKTFPVVLLGVIRTLSVKGTEYPEHQTEYGTHWNFFITLALIPVLQVLLHPLMLRVPIALLGATIALVQQIALSSRLAEYILNAPRTNLISSNKEGIISVPGYLAVHLIGLSMGTLLLPPSPSYFRRRLRELAYPHARHTHDSSSDDDDAAPAPRSASSFSEAQKRRYGPAPQRRENDKTAIELCSYAVVWWLLLAIAQGAGLGGGVSRRMVNLPYVVWVAAFNTSFLLGYLLLDLFFFGSPLSRSVYSPTSKLKVHPDPSMLHTSSPLGVDPAGAPVDSAPALLAAINKNGLALFLLANVATGMVNLSMRTMYASDLVAMGVLSLYAAGVCGVAWACRDRKLWRF